MKLAAAFFAFMFCLNVSGDVRAADIDIETLFPPPAVNLRCNGQHCVPTYRLNDEISSSSVKQAIAWIDSVNESGAKAMVFEINSPGGSVGAGFELSKAIENSMVPVTCVVDGMAASMGAFILQSCPVRVMTKRSSLMFHEIALETQFGGHPNDWQAMAEALRVMNEALSQHCNHRLTTSIKEYRARIEGGRMWWMTAADAMRYHAVDKLVLSVQEVIDSLNK